MAMWQDRGDHVTIVLRRCTSIRRKGASVRCGTSGVAFGRFAKMSTLLLPAPGEQLPPMPRMAVGLHLCYGEFACAWWRLR